MKILFTVNIPSPYRVDFFNELGKLCDLTVLFEEGAGERSGRHQDWYDENYKSFNAVFLKQTKLLRNKVVCFDIKNYLKNDFDLIVVGNYSTFTGIYAINYMNRNSIPFAIEADGALHGDGRGFKERLKNKLISSANWWFSTSDVTDEYFLFYGAKEENIYRYPFTSVSEKDRLKELISQKEKLEIREHLGMKEKEIVLSVGRFVYGKGFDLLIDATQHLDKDVGVYIVGGKPPKEYVEQKERLGLNNIHFIDFVPKEKLLDYYKASSLFVLPTRGDVWGLVINEAMATGLPVITTDQCVAGLELIENGENGYVVPVENSLELGNKMQKIISNTDTMKKMGQLNLNKIQSYTIENMSLRHKEIFNEIINSSR